MPIKKRNNRFNHFVGVILSLILISSCASEKTVSGVYYGKNNKYSGAPMQLTINADGSFTYITRSDIIHEEIRTGTWEVKRNKLLLDIYIKPLNQLRVESVFSNEIDGLRIKVIDSIYHEMLLGGQVKVNDLADTFVIWDDGVVINNVKTLDSLSVDFVGFNAKVTIPEKTHNDINLILDLNSIFNYVFRVHSKYRIRRKSLIPIFDKTKASRELKDEYHLVKK